MIEGGAVAVAYARGTQRFMGLELLAEPGALVPREETELLGATALELLRAMKARTKVIVDMCCGSANLACGIAVAVPDARVWASDLTDGCVALAQKNVEHLGLRDRVTVRQGDLFAGLARDEIAGKVDLVVCNPPYISTGKLSKDSAHLLEHEPREAFDGGPYGLSIHGRVIKDALEFLVPGGALAFEMGLGQDRQLAILFDRARGYEGVELRCNARSEARVAFARRRSG